MAKQQPSSGLLSLQRKMGQALFSPLTQDWGMQKRLPDGQMMDRFAETFVKPNDRLTSFERLEIYNRQYWFRLIDSLYEDFPSLQAALGDDKFQLLICAYLQKYPPNSYTLRDLGLRLPQFIKAEQRFNSDLAFQIAEFECAQILAFDAEELPVLTADDIVNCDPQNLKVKLQPYVSLLELDYALDNFDIAIKRMGRQQLEACTEHWHAPTKQRSPRRCKKAFMAVHRVNCDLYFKRLDRNAFELLCRLRDGETLAQAIAQTLSAESDVVLTRLEMKVQQWFAEFTDLGWLCPRN